MATILARFADSLAKSGQIRLRDDLDVTPPDPCETAIRFERTPVGHLILKVEMKWGDGDGPRRDGDEMDLLLGPGNGSGGSAVAEPSPSGEPA